MWFARLVGARGVARGCGGGFAFSFGAAAVAALRLISGVVLTARRRVGFEAVALLDGLQFALPGLVVAAGAGACLGPGEAEVDGPDPVSFSPLEVELPLPVSELGFGPAGSVLLEDLDLRDWSFGSFHVLSFLRL